MKTIFAFDTEDDSRGNVYCINFFDGNEHNTFFNSADALEFLSNQKGIIELWAVNLGYDLNNLFREHLTSLEIVYAGSRVISARLRGTKVYFRDTLNHWKMSVEKMGERIGLPKIKTRDRKNVEYCRRDTEITWRFVNEMRVKYEEIGCKLKATIGSTALEYYYTQFSQRPTEYYKLTTEEIEFCKKGYHGGRVEIFHTKALTGNIQYFDINSLYPSVMRDFEYPNLDKRRWVKKINLKNEGMAHVEVESPDLELPYLPFRGEGKGLLFPVGKFRGHYTYFEIRRALELGYKIHKVFSALEFEGKSRPFVAFVETLYKKRLEAQAQKDDLMSECCKLLANNLYGKFGQGNEFTKLIPLQGLKNYEGVVYGEMLLSKKVGKYPPHSNGIWACYTTAYARDRLYLGLKTVKQNNGLLIYCDTDSIIFESEREVIKASNKLGEFKLEGHFRYAHFKLPKLYCLIPRRGKWTYKAKGIPRKHGSTFFRTGGAVYRRPFKLRETLRRNLSPKRKVKLIPNYWEVTKKEMRKTYDKRIVKSDGTTCPIRI